MLRDIILFFAGFEAMHTLSHIVFAYTVKLPVDMTYVVLTPTINYWGIAINGAITIGLLWLASRLKRT